MDEFIHRIKKKNRSRAVEMGGKHRYLSFFFLKLNKKKKSVIMRTDLFLYASN